MNALAWIGVALAGFLVLAALTGWAFSRFGRMAAESDAALKCEDCGGLGIAWSFAAPSGVPYCHECPTCHGAGMAA